MGTYIVAYDLNKERKGWDNDRANMLAHIKKTWNWALLSESSYAIEAPQSASAVYNTLRGFIDKNDNIYVITISRPWDGFGAKVVIDWLLSKIGKP